jgi:hypothetical protein
LHKIPKKFHRQNLSNLIEKYGNWDKIEKYYKQIHQLSYQASDIVSDSTNADLLISTKDNIQKLFLESDDNIITHTFESLHQNSNKKRNFKN